MLIVPDTSDAIDWYRRALGAANCGISEGWRDWQFGEAAFFVHEINPDNPSESSPGEIGRTSTRIELFVDDPDEFLAARCIGWSGPQHADRGAHGSVGNAPPGRISRSVRSQLVRRRQIAACPPIDLNQ